MLHQLTSAAKLAVLGKYGVREDDLDTIIQQSDCKNNPVTLDSNDMAAILTARL
jgi:hypothetical protein